MTSEDAATGATLNAVEVLLRDDDALAFDDFLSFIDHEDAATPGAVTIHGVTGGAFPLGEEVEFQEQRDDAGLHAEAPLLSLDETDVLLRVLQEEAQGAVDASEANLDRLQPLGSSYSLSGVRGGTSSMDTGASTCVRTSEDTDAAAELPPQPMQSTAKPRRRRKRQSDELDYLRKKVFDLEGELERLRRQESAWRQEDAAVVLTGSPRNLLLPPGSVEAQSLSVVGGEPATSSRSTGSWERIASYERGQKRIAMLENLRLRARYESQLQVARALETLYHDQNSFAMMEPDVNGFLYKRPRSEPSSDDAAIFASLGHDFDMQYTQVDAIFEATGFSQVDREMVRDMQLKRNERGNLCLEHLQSKVLPFHCHVIDHVFWQCASSEEFQRHHGVYQVHQATSDTIRTRMIDPLRLPNAETATLTTHTAIRRYIEEHRVVAVWEAIVETSGSVSMRLREKGWNILRPARARLPNQTGPVSIIQTCVRITPELQGEHTEQDLTVGTLTNLIVGTYHRHKELMHRVSENLLVTQFENFTV